MNNDPGSRSTDRVAATGWIQGKDLIAAVAHLQWSFAALRPLVGAPGSSEREIFDLASKGFRAQVDYILDSLDRLIDPRGEGK